MKPSAAKDSAEARIIAAARTVFIEKGFDGASMSDIAKEAGITRTSLNYYFRTKEKLFTEIYREIAGEFLPLVEKIVLNDRPVFERIADAVDLYTEMLLKNPDLVLFIARESASNPDAYFGVLRAEPELRQRAKRIGQAICGAMRSGTLRTVPLEYFATTFFGLLFFPFLGRKILTGVFFKNDARAFLRFVRERKGFVVECMQSIFSPEKR